MWQFAVFEKLTEVPIQVKDHRSGTCAVSAKVWIYYSAHISEHFSVTSQYKNKIVQSRLKVY